MMNPIKVKKYYSLLKKNLHVEAALLAQEINAERSQEEIDNHDGIVKLYDKRVFKNGLVWRPVFIRERWTTNKCFTCNRRFQGKFLCPRCDYKDKNPSVVSIEPDPVPLFDEKAWREKVNSKEMTNLTIGLSHAETCELHQRALAIKNHDQHPCGWRGHGGDCLCLCTCSKK